MKKIIRKLLLGAVVVVLLGIAYLAMFPLGQQPDGSFDAAVKHPASALLPLHWRRLLASG